MKSLLGEQFNSFIESYEQTPYAGIRINTLKITKEQFREISPFALEPIPWTETGYYVEEGVRPGRHPYYHAGLYYIQEPSAMAPVELLSVVPGDRVLDLCAAPGGKSTQIAAKLAGSGLLITNDLHPDRTKALAKNVEMYGVRNAIVLNEKPERIAEAFPEFFTKILIDAPCSGEGMFRKDEDMLKYWEESSPLKYADMQQEILASAAKMLSPGGRLVYSTCTFSPEENEGMIAAFLKDHSEFSVVPIGDSEWFSAGEAQWLEKQAESTEDGANPFIQQTAGTGRLWPHRVKGEGHFMAILQREGDLTDDMNMNEVEIEQRSETRGHSPRKDKRNAGHKHGRSQNEQGRKGQEVDSLEPFFEFVREQLHLDISAGHPVMYGNNIYLSPLLESRLKGLKAVRAGWYMGQIKNGRFVPGHPLATALHPYEACRSVNLSSADGEAVRYLKGETLEIPAERIDRKSVAEPKGYVLVCIDGYAAGWGKWQQPGILKNEYPAGWRWTSI